MNLKTSLLNNEVIATPVTQKESKTSSSPLLGGRKIAVVAPNQTIEATATIEGSGSTPNFTAHKNSAASPSMIEAPLSNSTTLGAKAHLRMLKQLDAQEQKNNRAMQIARREAAGDKGSYTPPTFLPPPRIRT